MLLPTILEGVVNVCGCRMGHVVKSADFMIPVPLLPRLRTTGDARAKKHNGPEASHSSSHRKLHDVVRWPMVRFIQGGRHVSKQR